MTFPTFSAGEVLRAQDMNAVSSWLIKTQAVGAGVSTVTVTGAFSADYDNYVVTFTGGTTTSVQDIRFRLGSTSTGYYGFFTYGSYTSNTVNGFARSNQSSFEYFGQGSTSGNSGYCMIQNPFSATRTGFSSTTLGFGTTGASGTFNGFLNDTSSYSAFTLFIDSGTMSGGTIRVYGYKN
jgi:hypothetical protein